MTPEQRDRARSLKIRNARRLLRNTVCQELKAVGLNAVQVSDERSDRLLANLKLVSPVADLQPCEDWKRAVGDFAVGRFGLTVGRLWDWEGEMPMFRMAAVSLRERVRALADVFPSGFWLVDDDDRQAIVVDLDFDEDAQLTVAHLKEVELFDA